ncbi:aegerolysin family protein [Streptomyces sp. NPDC006692]
MGVGERTTQVTIHNNTSCGLKAVESGLDHGQWYAWGLSPFVYRNNQATFGTYSDGLATGVEGHATYQTYDCYDGAKNNRIVKVYWDNPYVGSNAYNTDGTDGAFSGSYSGGSGNHAYVDFWFSDK